MRRRQAAWPRGRRTCEAAMPSTHQLTVPTSISFFLGGMTIVLSFFAFFLLGTPREVLWLSPEQKRMAAARVAANKTGSDRLKRYWNTSQALSVFRDPQVRVLRLVLSNVRSHPCQTIFFFVVNFVNNLPNGGTTSFGNLVYVSFGFSNLEVSLI